MIYLDPTDLHSREQEIEHLRAIGYTAEGAAGYVTRYRQEFAAYIATLPPVVQVETEADRRHRAERRAGVPAHPARAECADLDRPRRQARALDLRICETRFSVGRRLEAPTVMVRG